MRVIRKKRLHPDRQLLVAILLGSLTGWAAHPLVHQIAGYIAIFTTKILQLLSLPILFLSIVATLGSMNTLQEMRSIGKHVLKYTLLTTLVASILALLLYLRFDPASYFSVSSDSSYPKSPLSDKENYFEALVKIFPSNFLSPIIENNVFAIVLIAVALGFSILSLEKEKKQSLQTFFSALFQALLNLTRYLLRFMPIGVFAFTVLFVEDVIMNSSGKEKGIFFYTLTILGANVIQGLVCLPLFLLFNGLSPWRLFKGMLPAIQLAFFSKSSNAALPVALENAETMGLSRRVSHFSLPLCTTINMNGCAAFILITTLTVATVYGYTFSFLDYLLWTIVATIAAVGNAGVPMGCFFLSSALLTGLGIPLEMMGLLLPIYSLIDMVETALNVWSDSCVTAITDKAVTRTTSPLATRDSLSS